jgi:hypothetical protein
MFQLWVSRYPHNGLGRVGLGEDFLAEETAQAHVLGLPCSLCCPPRQW